MAVSREEMLMQSIATGEPSNISPVTREERYLSYIAGESANKPNAPITRKEVFLDKIPQGGGGGGGCVTIRNQNKTITENGTYTADSGYTGLGTVTVEVASSGGGDLDALIDGTITEVDSGAAVLRKYAFAECSLLERVNGANVTTLGDYAFSRCYSLTSVDFPRLESLGQCAFQYCVRLTNVNFPKITSLLESAFKGCKTLASINFPNLTETWPRVFSECSSITSVNVPKLTKIGGVSFYGCKALTSLDFPSATSVGGQAFQDCNALVSVNLHNVTQITSSTFSSCYSLKAVILRSETICTLATTNAFYNCYHILGTKDYTYNPNSDKDGYIYVPRALLSDTDETMDYRRTTNWATYATQFRALEDYTVDGTTTGALDPNKI